MLGLKKIAVTGRVSAGKSTVCEILQRAGAYIVHADALVHELLESEPDTYEQVLQLLGSGVLSQGKIDRKKVAALVFTQIDKLKDLENIIHPKIIDEICKRYQQICKTEQYRFFVAEIPLLFEAHFEPFFDIILNLTADPDLCRKRFVEKTGYLPEEWDKREQCLLPQEIKQKKATYTLINNGSLEELNHQVNSILNSL